MINDIYVFDDIIEKPYQELIKETLLGGDKPPTVGEPDQDFAWYYTSVMNLFGITIILWAL